MTVTTQACERIYRTLGGPAQVRTALRVEADAHLDWLPQETILFEDSDLERHIEADLHEGASLTAVEAVLLGRDAMGEAALRARLQDRWRIRRCGRLIHAEATRLGGSQRERQGLALLAGHRAFATIVHVAPTADAVSGLLHRLRARHAMTAQLGMSGNGERLVIRAMAHSGLALRRLLIPILADVSATGTLPRMWTL